MRLFESVLLALAIASPFGCRRASGESRGTDHIRKRTNSPGIIDTEFFLLVRESTVQEILFTVEAPVKKNFKISDSKWQELKRDLFCI